MIFSSITFIYFFLPTFFILYFILPKCMRNLLLLLSGFVFYAWGEPVYLLVMIVSILADYLAGLVIYRNPGRPKVRLWAMISACVVNLGLLAVFKYASLFITTFNGIFGTAIPDPALPLPIGISFFTFQSMSYVLDLYLGNIRVQKSPIKFGAYVVLFPQLVAGPIVRYEDVAEEMEERHLSIPMVGDGVALFVRGLAKKTLLANNIGALWTIIKATPVEELSVLSAWLGILAFTFQIYFDFAGYSDMACGMGLMMGFHFPKNFDLPYLSRSISEFWRRWHMTLGTWFRLYVYIPLGGNRGGVWKTVRNLMIVWMLTGFWHGASWNFLLWGGYFGVLIILERFFLGRYLERWPAVLSTAYTFLLVVIGWVLFEFTALSDVGAYLGAMVGIGGAGLVDASLPYWIRNYGAIFLLCAAISFDLPGRIGRAITRRSPNLFVYLQPAVNLLLMVVSTAYLVDATYNPFLYFRF